MTALCPDRLTIFHYFRSADVEELPEAFAHICAKPALVEKPRWKARTRPMEQLPPAISSPSVQKSDFIFQPPAPAPDACFHPTPFVDLFQR
jgi:hypothetical protein